MDYLAETVKHTGLKVISMVLKTYLKEKTCLQDTACCMSGQAALRHTKAVQGTTVLSVNIRHTSAQHFLVLTVSPCSLSPRGDFLPTKQWHLLEPRTETRWSSRSTIKPPSTATGRSINPVVLF